MKNILLIDDLRNFRVKNHDDNVVIARTSEAAITVLQNNPDAVWDEIWFDHDLGLLVDGTPDTTMAVVDYFAEKAFFKEPVNVHQVYIHTSNPPGRNNVRRGLEVRGYTAKVVAPEPIFIVD